MKAKITFNKENTGRKVAQNRKEDHYYRGLKFIAKAKRGSAYAKYNGGLTQVVDVRFYGAGRCPSRIYCCIWAGDFSGGGYAGGSGYDRESAALEDALTNAGITLPWALGGTGENERAVQEIAAALGYKTGMIVSCHG